MVYIYQHLDVESHKGWLKVGETTCDVEGRVRAQNEADNVRAEILWTAEAVRYDGNSFSDKDIHRFLETKGIEREKKHNTETNRDSEWFKIELETLIGYILAYKEGASDINQRQDAVVTLRKEQQAAVDITKTYWEKCQNEANMQPEFLWNAKPRFGKTLTAYYFAKSIQAKRILIVTNRPAIADSWYSDFKKFIQPTSDYIFASSDSISRNNREILTREDILAQNLVRKDLIYFISLQDIKGQSRGSELSAVNAYKQRNQWLFELRAPWDLLIIDESHEGVDTAKSFHVLTNLNFRFALHLSGTPFKAIQNAKFHASQIYNWSYTDEQNAKAEWCLLDGENPYAALPRLNVFTYQLSRALALTAEQAKDEGSEYAFDLGEFFRIVDDAFSYESEIGKFLDNLCNPDYDYPFSKVEYLESLRHTFWLLPGVKECAQMKKLLGKHGFFKDYAVILAAGTGDEDRITKTALEEVKQKIGNNPFETKTITLSCGQLTTGVTVPAWTAVLMLNNCKSPALYMQSAFRSQNPFEFAGQMKTDCFVFDFAPDRVLQTIADFADNMHANATETREKKVKMLLNFLPVIAEDDEGKMRELDANEVLTIPLKLITQEVVNRGFMSNRLFDNISGIFGAPRSVLEILEKIKPEENKRLGDPQKNIPNRKVKIWIDNNKKVHIGEDIVINTTNGLLGDKKYVVIGSDEEREAMQIITDAKVEMQKEGVPHLVQQIILKELEKKMPAVVARAPGLQEMEEMLLPEQPDEKPKKNEKSEEEKVRDRLRGFTRTIPSFLMAYGNETTTLANFEQNIPEKTFKELTNITKAEFQQLRDGFEYEEDGERKRFEGLFNCDVFNASIALFLNKKQELANYFKSDGEDIFDYIPPQETNQIFTPKRVVKMMIDSLQDEHPELFESSETTFCDLYMKSGLFITEVTRRLFEKTRHKYTNDRDCIKHILEKQVYGFAPTDILYNICLNLIFGFDAPRHCGLDPQTPPSVLPRHCGLDPQSPISRGNFFNIDTVLYCKNQQFETLLNENNMKFDVIIGNPPYQEGDGSGGSSDAAVPIYNIFVEQAKKLNPKYLTMIIPAKWMVGGRGLQQFRENMKSEKRISYIYDFENATDCFNGIHLDGGVCYFLWDKDYNGKIDYTYKTTDGLLINSKRDISNKYFDFVIRDNRRISIIEKVSKTQHFSEIVSQTRPYGIRKDLFNEPERYPDSNLRFEPFENCLKIYGVKGLKGGAKRIVGYISPEIVTNNKDSVDKFKLFFTTSYSTDAVVPPEIIVGKPNEICTETFLLVGPFENEQQQQNCLAYMQTDFFKILLFFGKGTMQVTKSVFDLIPLQDFNEAWTDEKLYAKYDLSPDEITFIERTIRPLD